MSIIFGRKPVLEAINAGDNINRIYILYGQKGDIITTIKIAAKKKGIKCNEVPVQKFKELTNNPNTQGVIAEKTSYRYYTIEELLKQAKQKQYPLLLILDSIQDTHNYGAILRSAECSGVDGVIVTKHNSAPLNETVVKTSAGAVEYSKICQVNNLAQTMDLLKKEGYWIFGSSLEGGKEYTMFDYKQPVALVMGNEEKGIRKLTADKCDNLIYIPMQGKIQSLNVSVATGVLLFGIENIRRK